ncbi:hypothetical protein ACJH6H_14820 [Mycobacterium sp. SMC-21]|uniref:hypothetical protein n=1 Tax=Mycobacterium sp. SMC-21 TaxID=3381632 RepID=UPI003875CBAD
MIIGDEGFLTVVPGLGGIRRWRAFHDNCGLRARNADVLRALAGYDVGGLKSVVVRTGAVATYTELLTTLAELARCPELDFAQTAWPALLQRLAFDTDWELTDGRGKHDLRRENATYIQAAGLGVKGGAISVVTDADRERMRLDSERSQRRNEQRRAETQLVTEQEIAG